MKTTQTQILSELERHINYLESRTKDNEYLDGMYIAFRICRDIVLNPESNK